MTRHEKPTTPPKVSIGMPVYNGERYIREALDSLLAQTHADFELIISDNASTDGTEAVCRGYAARDPRIRYVRQSENRGAMANFRFVLDEAAGEYFMWAAADDRWDAWWLDALLKRLDPGVAVAFGSTVSFRDDGQKEMRFTLRSLVGPRTLRMLRFYLWTEWSTKANVIYGLYRTTELRKVATEVIGQTADWRVCLDDLLVFTMLEVGRLCIEPSVTFYKRRPVVAPRLLLAWRRLPHLGVMLFHLDHVPYLMEHVRRSPPGVTRWAVLAATPIKYLRLVCRGHGRAAALILRRVRERILLHRQGTKELRLDQ